MMLRTTLLICLPLLTVTACGKGSKDKKSPPPVVSAEVNPTTGSTPAPTGSVSAEDALKVDQTPKPQDSKNGAGQNQSQNQSQPTTPETPKPECETALIDFEKGSNGVSLVKDQEMKDEYSPLGVGFIAHKELANGATVFDVKPVLVVAPLTGLAATTQSPDNARGGYVKLTFAHPTSVKSLDLIDVENPTSTIELFTMNDRNEYVSKSVQSIPQRGHNETFNVTLNDQSYVRKLTIKLTGSSSVDNIKICVKK
ncbi:MAG: hypothetical protein EOP10_00685 [Proteobacteria bacterium]|nr:MAG: hypothetical protein EOP10_00685 [Pseudomonadota bacterium]